MVTLFAWMAHRLVSSKRCTMKSSVACVAATCKHWPLTMHNGMGRSGAKHRCCYLQLTSSCGFLLHVCMRY